MENQGSSAKKSRRGLLRIVFSRTMLITLVLIVNFLLLYGFLFDLIQGLPILFGSMVVFTAVMELLVLNGSDSVDAKLSWAVLIGVLPLFGAFLYLFVKLEPGSRVSRKLILSSVQSSLAFLPENSGTPENPETAPIATYLLRHAHAPAFSNTDVHYYPLGEDMFRDLLADLEQAEKFIFMEYFLVSHGHMWDSILEILMRKAAQGVEVRFLYDGMNAFTNLPYGYPGDLERAGIRCKMHAPVRPFVSTHYNNRDHRKITVIDGHTAYTGGVNLEDCYINIGSPFGHWKDTALRLRGDGARGFTFLFLQMWNANERQRPFHPYLEPVKSPTSAPGWVIPYGDVPMDGENVGETVYLTMINQAHKTIRIMTPYLIPDEKMLSCLQMAAKRGVDVRLILPGIPDKKTAFALARSHYRELLEAGVKIFEYTPGFVHAKVFLCDDIHAVVGTINLDYRSLRHHFECAAYLYRVEALGDIRRDFENTLALCRPVRPEDLMHFPAFYRIFARFGKFFAPLM